MNKLSIDYPPTLKFVDAIKGEIGGGFTFSKNEINIDTSYLFNPTYKVVGTKNGEKITVTSPKEKLPLYGPKDMVENILNIQSKHGNLGFDKLEMEPVTDEDNRNYLKQQIFHEVVHAQQHMFMRKTE